MAGLVLAGSCVFFWFFSIQSILERRAILAHAVAVDAVVETAGQDALRFYTVNTGDGSVRMFEPQVRVRYSVDGRDYTSDSYSCGQCAMQKEHASLIAASYSPGQHVTAWHPADAPAQAFLVRAYEPTPHIGLMMLGPALVICGGIMLTALVPVGSLEDPDPRVTLATGLLGTAISGGVLAHHLTQSAYPIPPLMWLAVMFLLGIPAMMMVWGGWHCLTDRSQEA